MSTFVFPKEKMMKKKIYVLLICSCICSLAAKAEDSIQPAKIKKDKIKKGWNFGGLPIISYDADLGLQYGALVNLFDYGDGSSYPKALQSLYAEVSRYTKGSGINRFYYDTKTLIPGIRMFADVSYLTDKTMDFYGFNGYESVYNTSWIDENSDDYKSRVFYKYDRKIFRLYTDFQGKFKRDERFVWVLGINFYNYQIGRVDVHKLNEGKSEDKQLPDTATLYDHYMDWGILSDEERKGGNITYLKMGLSYDTRDHEATPTKGIWAEAILNIAPGFMASKGFGHGTLGLTFRQYIPLVPDKLTMAYRLGYQQQLYGDCPFFLLPNIGTVWLRRATSEGLGGATTLRGVKRQRVVGEGIAYANMEFRWNFLHGLFLNQNFMLALTAFADAGMVVDDKKINEDEVKEKATASDPDFVYDDYFKIGKDKPHTSVGAGFKIIMNRNFVISMDYGKPFNKQDGKGGFYIGINYIF